MKLNHDNDVIAYIMDQTHMTFSEINNLSSFELSMLKGALSKQTVYRG